MKNVKNILLVVLLVAIVGMSIGYAALSQQLTLNVASGTNASWDVAFTKITEINKNAATINGTPSSVGTTASFDVTLNEPGSYVTYEIEVSNNGSINAILDDVTDLVAINTAAPTEIVYTITGVNENDALNAGAKATFQVKVEWTASATTIPTVKDKNATIYLNYVQKAA